MSLEWPRVSKRLFSRHWLVILRSFDDWTWRNKQRLSEGRIDVLKNIIKETKKRSQSKKLIQEKRFCHLKKKSGSFFHETRWPLLWTRVVDSFLSTLTTTLSSLNCRHITCSQKKPITQILATFLAKSILHYFHVFPDFFSLVVVLFLVLETGLSDSIDFLRKEFLQAFGSLLESLFFSGSFFRDSKAFGNIDTKFKVIFSEWRIRRTLLKTTFTQNQCLIYDPDFYRKPILRNSTETSSSLWKPSLGFVPSTSR